MPMPYLTLKANPSDPVQPSYMACLQDRSGVCSIARTAQAAVDDLVQNNGPALCLDERPVDDYGCVLCKALKAFATVDEVVQHYMNEHGANMEKGVTIWVRPVPLRG